MAATPLSPNALSQLRYLTGTNFEDAITATAGGGQSGAYKLTAQMSVIDTVATSGDSVALPKCTGNVGQGSATPGQVGFISFGVNNSLNTLQLFGQTPDTINDVATATGVPIGPGRGWIAWPIGYTQSSNLGDWFVMVTGSPVSVTTEGSLLRYTSIPIGDTAYSSLGTNTTDIAGQVWVTSIYIPVTKTITKLGFLQGATATTDNTVLAIYNSAGTLIGNTALAGAVLSGANTFQEQVLTNPASGSLTLTPGLYFMSVQGNGTAAGALKTVATATFINVVSEVISGSFGVLPAIAVPTTFTAGQAPIMSVF